MNSKQTICIHPTNNKTQHNDNHVGSSHEEPHQTIILMSARPQVLSMTCIARIPQKEVDIYYSERQNPSPPSPPLLPLPPSLEVLGKCLGKKRAGDVVTKFIDGAGDVVNKFRPEVS